MVITTKLRYNHTMSKTTKNDQAFREALHMQAVEDNPLDANDLAMFERFEREGWSSERRRAYILAQANADAMVPAAE